MSNGMAALSREDTKRQSLADAVMHTARVPCSNADNIGERKTWTESEFCTRHNSIRARAPKCIYSVPAQDTAKNRAKFG